MEGTVCYFSGRGIFIRFRESVTNFSQKGIPADYGFPYFKEEVTPSPEIVLEHFTPLFQTSEVTAEQWAKAIETTPFEYLLVIMGQRWTSASIKDIRALPPSEQTLLESCFAPYNDQITMVTRAWEKHMGRSTDAFWGIAKGNPAQKEETIKQQIIKMIQTKTWWNIFYHYKNKDGTQLIGFLEPFL